MIGRENAQTNFANSTANEKVKAQLKSFYRGEVSAVETYQRALEHSAFVGVADVLRSCQASHQQRVGLLRERLRRIGCEVPESSGPWGTMVSMLEDAAVAISQKMAIGLLEEGEDHGLRDYRDGLDVLGPDERQFVNQYLMPAQLDTHRQMSNLKQAVTDGA